MPQRKELNLSAKDVVGTCTMNDLFCVARLYLNGKLMCTLQWYVQHANLAHLLWFLVAFSWTFEFDEECEWFIGWPYLPWLYFSSVVLWEKWKVQELRYLPFLWLGKVMYQDYPPNTSANILAYTDVPYNYYWQFYKQ